MVKRYAGISFRCSRRVYCFEVGALSLKVNDDVVVETDRGVNMGQVVVSPETATLPEGIPVESVKKVLRKARKDDFEKLQENTRRELEVAQVCQEKIKSFKLKMKLVRAEFMHDGNRVIFYFTAENRVDFRELVKDLAHTLHVRVEMRQIGIRDAAGMIGGVGICGRELCCSAFLSTFDPVTVKMAKEQNLALNPMKISGICGRLMCCLGYEYENYSHAAGTRKGGNNRRRGGKNADTGSGSRRAQETKNAAGGKEGAGNKDFKPKETTTQESGQKESGQKESGQKEAGAKKTGSGRPRSKNSNRRGSRSGKGPRGDKNREKRKSQTS
jgi:cell fate regulator YaaT (PSP1 superfamily)